MSSTSSSCEEIEYNETTFTKFPSLGIVTANGGLLQRYGCCS